MIRHKNISIYISRAIISLILILICTSVSAQSKKKKVIVAEPDTLPTLRGFSVSTDMVGPIMLALSDYGYYECDLKINLKNKYFPVIEIGYGKADHNDDTSINYKTSAPYARIGCDFNILKNKNSSNRFFIGFRYAYTSYKEDISHTNFEDPVWQWDVNYEIKNNKCTYKWIEAVAGVDAKIWGPVHLGWSVRYKRRVSYDEGDYGKSWYVPGFGISNGSRLGGSFNIIIDI